MRRLLLALLIATSARALDVPGFVYDDEGQPLKGVKVEARVAGAGLAQATTGEDGGFVFRGLPDGVVELLADGRSALVYTNDVVTLESKKPSDGVPRRPQAALRGEGTVTGTITLNGKPLAHAPIVLQALREEAVEPVRVYSNVKGEFRATGLAAARYAVVPDERLRVRSPWSSRMVEEGDEPFLVNLTSTREARASIELSAVPMVRGRIVDAEGKPVPHARVQLVIADRPTLHFFHEPFVRTTPDGRFALPMPEWDPEEKAALAVMPFLHSTVRSKAFPVGTSDRTVDVTLPKFETVRVRVSDRAGKPVPRARVAAVPRAENEHPELMDMVVRRGPLANEQGELVLHLTPDTYDFGVVAEGFQNGTATKAIAKPGTVDVALERAASVRGRVHRNGRGVSGVNVMISAGAQRRSNTSVVTSDKGTFELDGLAPGPYRLMLFNAEEMIERTVEVEAPGQIDVALPPAGTLRGRVVDATTKAPLTEFTYVVEPAEGRGRVARAEVADDGVFTVTVPEGTYRVTAGALGYTSSETAEVRVSEQEPASVELRLGRGVTVAGRVTDEAGSPIVDADVMVVGRTAESARSRSLVRVAPGNAKTGEDGSFTITGIDPGEAALTVRKAGYTPWRKAIDANGTMMVDVRLTRGLSLRGIVVRGGRGVANVRVSAVTAAFGGEHQPAISGDDGRFVVTGLVPARYTVSAYLDETHVEIRDVDPTKDKELVVSLDPKPRGVVYGMVSGIPPSLGGKYVRRVVMVQSPDGGVEGTIDDAGNYRIENAPVGSVHVIAHLQAAPDASRTSVRKQVELVAGQPLRVDLEVTGNVAVSGRISHEGRPLAGAHIGFTNEQGVMASGLTRDDGTYDLALPAAGRYHIYARADQVADRHFSTVREVRSGDRIDIDLREQVLEGTVVDAVTRQPLANAIVSLGPVLGATFVAAEVQTDSAGRFRINTSSAGAHRLIAFAPGYGHRALPVESTTTHYVFELSPAAELVVRIADAASSTPLDAHLIVSDANGAFVPVRYERSTDGSSYSFSLAPGKYRLTVIVQGYGAKVVEVTAPGTIDVRM